MARLFQVVLWVFLVNFLSSIEEDNSDLMKIPCGGKYKPKNCDGASVDTLETVEDFQRCAPALLDPLVRDYVMGGSGRRQTLRENEDAFKTIRIRKRVLRNIADHSLETSVLGNKIAFPIAISPTAGQSFYHPEADNATVKAAASMGTIMALTDGSEISLEQVAASVPAGTNLWIACTLNSDKEDSAKLLRRAEKAGYKAILVTIDRSASDFWKCNTYGHFIKDFIIPRGLPNIEDPKELLISQNLTFADITWMTTVTSLPVVVKGVLTGEDAIEAVRAGASAIYVSNHGGRRLDGSQPTIDVLGEIVDAVHSVNPFIEVYIDGGVRNGFDAYKAIARGARAVFVGRPHIWGLVMGGTRGVEKVLQIMRDEFEEAMLHAGFSNPSEITRDSIIPPLPDFNCGSRYPL